MTVILIRARVAPEHRHELMRMCKEWLANQLTSNCLERRVYEDVFSPMDLLLVEHWSDKEGVNAYLSAEPFHVLMGAVKVLGELVDLRISEADVIEAG